jgi:hypothetical protein
MVLVMIFLNVLMVFDDGLLDVSNIQVNERVNIPWTVKFFIDGSTAATPTVETDDCEDASSLSPLPITLPSKFEAVELDLFFFGISGRTLPGSSVRNFL